MPRKYCFKCGKRLVGSEKMLTTQICRKCLNKYAKESFKRFEEAEYELNKEFYPEYPPMNEIGE